MIIAESNDALNFSNRLTTGPAGTYAYNNTTHRDAVTNTSGGYTAAYDDAGDMQCRAPTSSQTCQGTQTGQQMSYDQLRRILNWQNAASNPTATAHYAYDGEGNRTIQNSYITGTQTVTYYLGNYEEIATSGSNTTTTKYYKAGPASSVDVNGTLTYLVSDGLGNASASLDANGNEVGADLYQPYGGARYTSGSLSTTKGFTGHLQDPSGLDYFTARYYDPVVGQFATEDTVQGPNRYAYVAGNPETLTDPTGQFYIGHPIFAGGTQTCGSGESFIITGNEGQCAHVGKDGKVPSCDPTTSLACNNWVTQNDGGPDKNGNHHMGYRERVLSALQTKGVGLIILGVVIEIAADIINIVSGVPGNIVEGIVDLIETVGSTLLPLIGQFFWWSCLSDHVKNRICNVWYYVCCQRSSRCH